MTDKQIKATLKAPGAAEHFGVKQSTLDGYIKRGKYPPALILRVLDEQKEQRPAPAPQVEQTYPGERRTFEVPLPKEKDPRRSFPAAVAADMSGVERRVEDIAKYIQGTVDFYIRQFSSRIAMLEKGVIALSNAQLRATGLPNLARPDENVPVDQTFTTSPLGNAFDTGIAPTKEMVDAQSNMTTLEGVPVPNARVAGPAEFIPNQPSYGFGWNQPRPPRR